MFSLVNGSDIPAAQASAGMTKTPHGEASDPGRSAELRRPSERWCGSAPRAEAAPAVPDRCPDSFLSDIHTHLWFLTCEMLPGCFFYLKLKAVALDFAGSQSAAASWRPFI